MALWLWGQTGSFLVLFLFFFSAFGVPWCFLGGLIVVFSVFFALTSGSSLGMTTTPP